MLNELTAYLWVASKLTPKKPGIRVKKSVRYRRIRIIWKDLPRQIWDEKEPEGLGIYIDGAGSNLHPQCRQHPQFRLCHDYRRPRRCVQFYLLGITNRLLGIGSQNKVRTSSRSCHCIITARNAEQRNKPLKEGTTSMRSCRFLVEWKEAEWREKRGSIVLLLIANFLLLNGLSCY